MTDSVVLGPGAAGDTVRDLQARLTRAGHPLAVDGCFGPRTEDAVRAFQAHRHLRADGRVGPETWTALVESAYSLGDRLLYVRQPMLRGDDVSTLQRRLNALGFDAGREDAIFGPDTERAVRTFQRDAGLPPDGVCGPATCGALERLGTLAGGSVAVVRERDALRREPRSLTDRRIALLVDPGLDSLGHLVAKELGECGAVVDLDTSGAPDATLAEQVNRFAADLVVALRPGAEPRSIAFFATPVYESIEGRLVATRLHARLAAARLDPPAPVGRTSTLLRETRMPAVVCELCPTGDAPALHEVVLHAGTLAEAIAAGLRDGVEQPPDATS